MKKILFLFIFLTNIASAQKSGDPIKRPKLVVGIVIDQMRYDFLYRYYERYGEGGFKKLINQGNSCENMFINYLPSYTGPGHACIYTGSVPSLHGIASNDWIDVMSGDAVYCTDDATVKAVGGTQRAGKMSPKNLWASTITDELRLASNFKSKTIAISVKDRASILPGGHTANGAYWLDDSNGVFMSSTYYMSDLPSWVSAYNETKKAKQYMDQNWNTLYAAESYVQSTSDANAYEGKFLGEQSSSFPHKTSGLLVSDIKKTPYGNSLVLDFAKAALSEEHLGQGIATDFLTISCSSTDYVGHMYGPNSMEIEDTYLRLDKDLADFIQSLDETVGEGNYVLFLTADHGVAHNPQFLMDQKIPAGFSKSVDLKKELNEKLLSSFKSDKLVLQVAENFVWINHKETHDLKLDEQEIKEVILEKLRSHAEIQFAVDVKKTAQSVLPEPIKQMAINGYNAKRSGDILLILNPGWLEASSTTGTTHGTWNPYDTHIPMLWYGWGIQKGRVTKTVHMTDIAATLATLLHIQMPNACVGQCIEEVIK